MCFLGLNYTVNTPLVKDLTKSISRWTFFCTSGWWSKCRKAKMRELEVVSIPAMKRSIIKLTIVGIPSLGEKQESGFELFFVSTSITSRKSRTLSGSRVFWWASTYLLMMPIMSFNNLPAKSNLEMSRSIGSLDYKEKQCFCLNISILLQLCAKMS